MCKNNEVIECFQCIRIFNELIVWKMKWFTKKSRITKAFSGYILLLKNESHFVPKKITSHVKMSQLFKEPSYISKFTIWTELQKKTLPFPPMEKQLCILPQLTSSPHLDYNPYVLHSVTFFTHRQVINCTRAF